MKHDLRGMNRKGLESLRDRIDRQIEKLKSDDLEKAKAAAEKAAKAHGFSLADLGTAPTRPRKPAKAGAPRYADPADPSKTWTGKGRQPEWYKAAIAAGAKPEELAIK